MGKPRFLLSVLLPFGPKGLDQIEGGGERSQDDDSGTREQQFRDFGWMGPQDAPQLGPATEKKKKHSLARSRELRGRRALLLQACKC